jgi:hypothetical protein
MKTILLRSTLILALSVLALGIATRSNVARADEEDAMPTSSSEAARQQLQGSLTELMALTQPEVADVTVQLIADESDSGSSYLVLGIINFDGVASYERLTVDSLQALFSKAASSGRLSSDDLAAREGTIMTQAMEAIPA